MDNSPSNPDPIDVTGDEQSTVQRDTTTPMSAIDARDDVGYHDAGVIGEGQDNDYTKLDEQPYEALDEENDREVSARGGLANFTQDVDAEAPPGFHDDADIREGTLPIQDLTYGNTEPQEELIDGVPSLLDQTIRNTNQQGEDNQA